MNEQLDMEFSALSLEELRAVVRSWADENPDWDIITVRYSAYHALGTGIVGWNARLTAFYKYKD